MNLLKKYPFFLLLFFLFFCLHGWAENYSSISFIEVFLVGLSVFVVNIILFVIFYFFTRKILYAALITFFVIVWYFFFGAIHDFIKNTELLTFLRRYTTLLPLLIVATIIWIVFLKKNKPKWNNITLYLNLLLLIYCLIDAVKLANLSFAKQSIRPSSAFNNDLVKLKPNVYFLLFDGYPGQKTLTDSFKFSNEKFTNFLQKNEFVTLSIMSNYDKTHYSMSSIFNMQYVNQEYKVNPYCQKDYQSRQNEIKNGAVFSIFKNMGYRIFNYSIFDLEKSPGLDDKNSFLFGHSFLLTDKILLNRIRKNTWINPTGMVIKYLPFLQNQSIFVFRNSNVKAQRLLSEKLNNNSTNPIFCYTHILMPHEPYYFDSTGLDTNPTNFLSNEILLDRGKFISYLKYTNIVAEKMLLEIRKKDPNAIIIFMSDHGVRNFPRLSHFEIGNYFNICFLYFPNKNYGKIPLKITNVNVFTYLFNTQFNQQLSYLKDTSFTYIPAVNK